jgi:voltage-gated potassium channel
VRDDGDTRRLAWERRTEWPLTVIALAFLGAYAWPILDPSIGHGARRVCNVVTVASFAAFVIDYLVRLALASRRWHFVTHHVFDLAVIALPLLRPLRALRLLAALRILSRSTAGGFRGRVVAYVGGGALLILFVAALAVLDAERGSKEANITDFGDSVWWAMTTMTTVGYGDRFPTTGEGRLIGAALMLGGIALLGVVTATIASWVIERVQGVEEAEALTQAEIRELVSEVRALRDEMRASGLDGT